MEAVEVSIRLFLETWVILLFLVGCEGGNKGLGSPEAAKQCRLSAPLCRWLLGRFQPALPNILNNFIMVSRNGLHPGSLFAPNRWEWAGRWEARPFLAVCSPLLNTFRAASPPPFA